ncbi:MAG: GNAT family N-acetyltransferase [Geminicoccaceae bacterium]|nr:MAG: GNAT family N-acetyltransferase [Geminicoccaceae bacterium]
MSPSAETELRVQPVDAATWQARSAEVVDLLADAIEDNASLGFLMPPEPARIRRDWLDPVAASLAEGRHLAWLADDARGLAGLVLLELATKQNAPHRAEVQKLIVHRRCRRLGVGARLMAALEARALSLGRFLLLLDTDAGAGSVPFYRGLGWQDVGVIPAHALRPDGALEGTRLFYKDLREPAA